MLGSQDEAGSPRPLIKMRRCSFDGEILDPGKNVWDIGAVGLVGIVRKLGEFAVDIPMCTNVRDSEIDERQSILFSFHYYPVLACLRSLEHMEA
jgi:hypothetical protein